MATYGTREKYGLGYLIAIILPEDVGVHKIIGDGIVQRRPNSSNFVKHSTAMYWTISRWPLLAASISALFLSVVFASTIVARSPARYLRQSFKAHRALEIFGGPSE